MIWRAKATTYGSFMGACVLNGIGAGPAETMQPGIPTFPFPTNPVSHHRRRSLPPRTWVPHDPLHGISTNPTGLTGNQVSYFGSLMIGPIIAGAMTEHVNWQSFWWLNVAAFGVMIIIIVVAFPETKFINREAVEKQLIEAGIKPKSEAGTSTPTGTTTTTENGGEVDEAAIENTKSLAPMNTEAEVEELDPWLHKGYPGRHQFPMIWYPRLTKGNLAAELVLFPPGFA
jgi:MFS family permease